MNARRILFLAVAALLMAGAALWLSSSRRAQEQASVQQDAVPGLKERLNQLERVVVTGAGNQAIATIERVESNWVLKERDYAVDAQTLRTLLISLAEARRVEAKTSNPELYDRLGVEDVAAADAYGVKLELFGGGEPIALIVGENNARGKGTYVRAADEAQSWLLDRNIAVEKSTANWLERDLVDIEPERIAELQIERETDRVEIQRTDDAAADFVISNIPKGREPASEFIADSSAGLLQDLRFDDVAQASDELPVAPLRTAAFKMKDGLGIELKAWQDEGKTWASFAASLDEAAAVAQIEKQQAEAKAEWDAKQAAVDAADNASQQADQADGEATEAATADETATAEPDAAADDAAQPELAPQAPLAVTDPSADREARLAALRDELNRLNQRFAKRAFQLPSFKASNLNRDLEAYLKPKD